MRQTNLQTPACATECDPEILPLREFQRVTCEGKHWRVHRNDPDGVHVWLQRLNQDGSYFRGTWYNYHRKRISDCEPTKIVETTLEQLRAENAQLRERALAAETRNIGLIHEADNAKRGEATYKRWYEERKANHLQADAENVTLREALREIRDTEGKVCENYELCNHRACQSSYGAWAVADMALRATPRTAQVAEVVRLSIQLRESEKTTEENSGMCEWSLADREDCIHNEWQAAVDVLHATEEGETRQRDASAG